MQIRHRTVRLHTLLLWPLLAATLVACATDGPKIPPEEAYRQAVEEARRGHYQDAQRLFEQVRDADTPVRLEFLAEIGIADSLYKNGKYEEASAEYEHLFEIHSGDAIADYLKYQLGMCYYRRIDTIDRDQGLTAKARLQFLELISRYPDSDLVPAARENLRRCNNYLAERELYVGKFYFAKGNYRAAKDRFQRGLSEYGPVDCTPQLLHHLALSVDALGDQAELQRTMARLASEYPDSPWNRDLPAALADQRRRAAEGGGLLDRARHWWSGGDEPQETPAPAPPAGGTDEASPAPEGRLDSPPPAPAAAVGGAGEPEAELRLPARGWRWFAWLVGGVAEAATLSEATAAGEPGWPGAATATVDRDAATTPEAAPPRPSRWRRILTWLHGPPEEPAPAPVSAPVASEPAAAPASNLIIRRIPPVVEEPAAAVPAAPPTPPIEGTTSPEEEPAAAATQGSVAPEPAPPARTPLDDLVEGLIAAHPAPATESSPDEMAEPTDPIVEEPDLPAIQGMAPTPEESAPQESDAVAAAPSAVTPPVAAAAPAEPEAVATPTAMAPPTPTAEPAPPARPVVTEPDPASRGLVVEQFLVAGDDDGAPAPPTTPAAAAPAVPSPPATVGRPPLAERIEATLDASRPVPAAPREVAPLAVSGIGTRHQPPRPLPLPAYARPVPPASGEAELFPATPVSRPGGATAPVEWRALTAVEKRPATATMAPPLNPPAAEPEAEEEGLATVEATVAPAVQPDFWRGLRETYGRLAQSEE